MKRESQVMLRKSLELVEHFKKEGIGFIPMPIMSESDRNGLIQELQDRLKSLIEMSETNNTPGGYDE